MARVIDTLDDVTSVAFFRNLNQGQRGSSSRLALLDAFTRSGASYAETFQVNGTVAFSADDPARCAEQVAEALAIASPWRDVVFVRQLDRVAEILLQVALEPTVDPGYLEVSFFDEEHSVADLLPIAGRRCEVIRGGTGFAITLNEQSNESHATPTVERALATRVTSRGLPTLRRLVARFGQ